MIKNLLVNGCSFTAQVRSPGAKDSIVPWADHVAHHFHVPECDYMNWAQGGAGNFYIANSTIDRIESAGLKPNDTLILVMWSGLSRKDIRISQEYFEILQDYNCKNSIDGNYYLCSGGAVNSWWHHPAVKPCFFNVYRASNWQSLVRDSISYIMHLQNYLESKQFRYKFLSFINYWQADRILPVDQEYVIERVFCQQELQTKIDFSKWIFVNQDKDGLYEYALLLGDVQDDGFHPAARAHESFAKNIVIPKLVEYFN